MNFPQTAKEAASLIACLAAKDGVSVAKYCEDRGVSKATLTKWKNEYKSYNASTFLRLMVKKP